MLVIRKSDSRIFAFGASCSIVATGISTENQAIPFNAIAVDGVAPTANDFEVVDAQSNPVGHFHGGFSHEWTGTAVQSVAGYALPGTPEPKGKALTKREFLSVGMVVDFMKMNTILDKIPLAREFLDDYKGIEGIEYDDLQNPNSKLKLLLNAAKAASIIDDTVIENFRTTWLAMYPK
jgi:hypothetical protein